jgi:hypothetical protein
MTSRIDFMDLKDPLSISSGVLTGFRAVHLGLKYGDHYLTVPNGEISSWRSYNAAHRVITPYIHSSWHVDLSLGSPTMVAMLGEGWHVDSRWRLFLTEWAHQGADMGLWSCRPPRVTCVGTVSNILRACDIPITASTSLGLYNQLQSLHGRFGIERIK